MKESPVLRRRGRVKSIQLWSGLGVLLIGLAVRCPHLSQSFWYDEMTTVVEYVTQPWSKVLAAKSGEYVPNNHVLHTILVKLIYALATRDNFPAVFVSEALLRFPALLAGVLVPIALAWPLRRSDPPLALAVAIVTALHPWLVDFSVEARGYSLLLLLGITATNLLPTQPRERPLRYAAAMAMAIYTIPLAILLIPAHAVAVIITRRSCLFAWIKAAGIALLLAVLMYLPMYGGLLSYYRNPYSPTMTYREFLNALPRCALTGISIPNGPAILWVLPVIAIIVGTVLGWSRIALRPMLVTFGIATSLGILLPLVNPAATEVRFVPWILPWFSLSVVAAFTAPPSQWGKIPGALGLVILIAMMIWQDINLLPQQQIRQGIQLIDQLTPQGRDIMVLYLGARESAALYGNTTHRLLPAPDTKSMLFMLKKAMIETGHLPWVIIYYEKLAHDRNLAPAEARGLWTLLNKLYNPGPRLAGRLTPVTIYEPKVDMDGPLPR